MDVARTDAGNVQSLCVLLYIPGTRDAEETGRRYRPLRGETCNMNKKPNEAKQKKHRTLPGDIKKHRVVKYLLEVSSIVFSCIPTEPAISRGSLYNILCTGSLALRLYSIDLNSHAC